MPRVSHWAPPLASSCVTAEESQIPDKALLLAKFLNHQNQLERCHIWCSCRSFQANDGSFACDEAAKLSSIFSIVWRWLCIPPTFRRKRRSSGTIRIAASEPCRKAVDLRPGDWLGFGVGQPFKCPQTQNWPHSNSLLVLGLPGQNQKGTRLPSASVKALIEIFILSQMGPGPAFALGLWPMICSSETSAP
jgi:hypothetical protein